MENYRQFVNLLKRQFSEYKVSVRRTIMPIGLMGECILINSRKKQFYIRIDRNLDEEIAVNIVLHEWGHILSWNKPGDDHGIEWGKAYSKVYRMYERWIDSPGDAP